MALTHLPQFPSKLGLWAPIQDQMTPVGVFLHLVTCVSVNLVVIGTSGYHWNFAIRGVLGDPSYLLDYMGRNHQWPMESPHKGSAMRKTFIMQFQYFRSTYFEKTNQTQQWKHMSVLGFSLTGNSIVCSAAHTGKMQEGIKFPPYCSLTMRFYRWPPESPKKGPAMRKALIMQFQNNRSIIDSSILRKKSTTVISPEHQWISYHWQFYCLFNSPYTILTFKHLKVKKP